MTRHEYYKRKFHNLEYDAKTHRLNRQLAEQRYKKAKRNQTIASVLNFIAALLLIIILVSVAMLDSESLVPTYIFGVTVFILAIVMGIKRYFDDHAQM